MAKEVFLSTMDQYIKSIKESPPKDPGGEIYLPGELEYAGRLGHSANRDSLPADTRNELNSIAKSMAWTVYEVKQIENIKGERRNAEYCQD